MIETNKYRFNNIINSDNSNLPKISFKSSKLIDECASIKNLVKISVDTVKDVLRKLPIPKSQFLKH